MVSMDLEKTELLPLRLVVWVGTTVGNNMRLHNQCGWVILYGFLFMVVFSFFAPPPGDREGNPRIKQAGYNKILGHARLKPYKA